MSKIDKKRERLVLLDTHAIIHRAFHALPELTTPQGEPAGAVYGLSTMLMRIANELKPDHVIAAYDLPGPTHRHDVYKEYKAKRPKMDDMLVPQIARSRDVLHAFNIPIYEAPGFEADDVIGTIATKAKETFDVIIASGDMDTLQLVDDERVRVFTLRKGITDTILYGENAVVARYGFHPEHIPDYKGFAGDPSDNIIGVPGIGEKTATILVKNFGSVEDVYKILEKSPAKLRDVGITERQLKILTEHKDEAEFSKVLATIRINAPIDFKEPEKTFAELLNEKRITTLFTELGFRSLIPRIKLLSGSRFPVPASEPTTENQKPVAGSPADSALLAESAVMLWLTGSEITNPNLEDILNNTKSDTLEEAHQKLDALVEKEGLGRVYTEIEKPLIPVIEKLNKTGVLIERTHLAELSQEYHKKLDAVAARIYKFAGDEFNINSPKQLGEILFGKLGISGGKGVRQKKTSTGQLSTRESELAKLKGEHPIIAEILEHRELAKLLGTYIDAIPPLLGADGRLRTTFSQTGTTTGRISSRDPNLQNIPIKTESGKRIRSAFIAPPGRKLIAFDYSQVELRLAAILSGDEKLRAIFKSGEDVHTAVAAEVFNVSLDAVGYDMRRKAKVINFGILYGMGVNALKETLGTDRTEAQAYLTRYFETYNELATYLEQTKATAARLGYTMTLFGRKRFFPGMKSRLPYVKAQAERMAINAPLQGTQADMIKLGMIRIDELIMREFEGAASLVLQIHDELIFEVTDSRVGDFAPQARGIMESVLSPEMTDGVPIIVSGESGQNWGKMKTLN